MPATSRNTLLQTLRVTHLYFGVFIAPALLFFAFTGALQTFGLHETNRDHPNYKPAHWIAVLAQIHKKQVPVVPVRRPQTVQPGQPASPSATQSAAPSPAASGTPTDTPSTDHPHHRHEPADQATNPPQPSPAIPAVTLGTSHAPAEPNPDQPRKHNPIPLRIFFLVVCIGLFTSTVTGLYMSYKYNRNRKVVTATLIAGIVLPLLLLIP